MNNFVFEKFSNPDKDFYPVYGWTWNDVITRDGIEKQIDEMYSKNIFRAYIIPTAKEFRPGSMVTNLTPDYLSDEFFALIKYAIDYGYEKGIKFWIYDESGWPSGNANFLVTSDDPSLCMTAALDPAFENSGSPVTIPKFSDLTNIRATEKFISLTHESYREKLGDSFKKLAPVIFTDEPSIRMAPFTDTIKRLFRERTGEELCAEKIISQSDADFNIIYHDICATAFAKGYFEPIKAWCSKNGFLHTGHLDSEDDITHFAKGGYHQPMRLLRLLDVPGVDTIWGQIDPGKTSSFFPRLASSAAEQNGSGLSMTESLSVYGTTTYDRYRYVIGYQLIRGINIINPLHLFYDNSRYYSIRQRPSYSMPQPCNEYLGLFNSFLASLSYIMQCGKPDTESALYLPMCDLWANDSDSPLAAKRYTDMGTAIENSHGQFDIADDDIILSCDDNALKCGKIKVGRACYTRLYIPSDKYMPQKVRSRIDIFTRGGGEVYTWQKAHLFPLLDIKGDEGKLRVHKRICKNCEIYLIFNEAKDRITANIKLPENAYEVTTEGEKYKIRENYTFECGEIKIFIVGKSSGLMAHSEVGDELLQITEFEFSPLRRFTLSESGGVYKAFSAEKSTAKCGDWSQLLGDEFSGECEYRTCFELYSHDTDVILSLGDVKYSCEVFINGKSIGKALMPPYSFIIDKKLLRDKNELIIKVSNTAANAFVHFTLPEKWEKKHIGPYHEKSLMLEKNYVSGGLLGPVGLYKIK